MMGRHNTVQFVLNFRVYDTDDLELALSTFE